MKLVILTLISLVSALIPDLSSGPHDIHDTISSLTLPNLLEVEDISQLSWNSLNNIKLDTGRILIGKLGGGLWSRDSLPSSDQDWTIEFVFRSTGSNRDKQFADVNGISLFLVQQPNTKNFENFGGPNQFDGFQVLLNNKEKSGLKIFGNDGTKKIGHSLSDSIGYCEFQYLDSQVPFNIRMSYSGNQNLFKIQVDNNLCFKTDKIKIPSANYQIGVAGNTSPASEEIFEIFKINVWDKLTEDAIDDHGLMADGELKVAYEVVVEEKAGEKKPEEKSDDKDIVTPANVRESLMERNRRFREGLEADSPNYGDGSGSGAGAGSDSNSDHSSNTPINVDYNTILKQNIKLQERLDSLESILLNVQFQNKEAPPIEKSSFEDFKTSITKQSSELLDAITKLNQKVIGEVREHQFTMEELGKKVDLLMANHKEITYQDSKSINTYESSSNIIRYILITIVIVVLVLIVFVYRLRHDIKHSKLL